MPNPVFRSDGAVDPSGEMPVAKPPNPSHTRLWVIDVFAFDGRHNKAVLLEAHFQAEKVNYEVKR